MSNAPRPYPPSKLPPGFVYPKAFLDLLGSGEAGAFYPPWWLIDAESRAGEVALQAISELKRPWVPFAKTDDEDDIACFNAASPPAEIEIVMLTSTPERSYGFQNFDEWLARARKDAARWRGDDV